ncbi:hypothetical protein [Aeromonas enteropelogenes]|uniref:hypothetical protein n=1 Tax=Aeromonas enteropelogenes TaxID=29489 RepID=UPI002286B553|nr:hypothetical protein [Aeromonas enteropelogenes]MCZ0753881.1 hypothetical protein [Aeromonas enteropelogenes]
MKLSEALGIKDKNRCELRVQGYLVASSSMREQSALVGGFLLVSYGATVYGKAAISADVLQVS